MRKIWLQLCDPTGRPLAPARQVDSTARQGGKHAPPWPDLSAPCGISVPVEGVPVRVSWDVVPDAGGAAVALADDGDGGEPRALAAVFPGRQAVEEGRAVCRLCRAARHGIHLYGVDARPLVVVLIAATRPGQVAVAYHATALLWVSSVYIEQTLGVSDDAPTSASAAAPPAAPEAALAPPDETDADPVVAPAPVPATSAAG